MDALDDGDHIMDDDGVIATTEVNDMLLDTVDPSVLAFGVTEDVNPVSPEMSQLQMIHSTAQNGSLNGGNAVNIIKRQTSTAPKFPPLPYASSRTGLVYDVRMRFHVEPDNSDNDMHPEDPRRIFEVYNELVQAGLVDDPTAPDLKGDYLLLRIPIRSAVKEEVRACHSQRSWDLVMDLKNWDEDRLITEGRAMDSVYLSVNTATCALLAAGGAIEAGRAVLNKQVRNAIAVIRPPGHHAEHNEPMGFCIFNNVPIAVRACQKEFGEAARKILIVDWDVHHGNGVQNIFYEDPNVLYISLHLSLNGTFYPMFNQDTGEDIKDHMHCGAGAGIGKNINIPWKTSGMGDGDYMYAFQQIVMPIAQDFNPDAVFVCSGFDAAEGDMIGGCHVTPAAYAHMTHMLMSLADGKIIVCMEGGYNLRSIAVSALAVTRTLMGEQPERLQSTQPSPSGVDVVQMVLRQQSKFWPCLHPRDPSQRLRQAQALRVHDVIREWQANLLYQSHEMTPLFIARNRLSKSFENQVLGTSNYFEARPLLLIFHDPPELIGSASPRTQQLELHNTYLVNEHYLRTMHQQWTDNAQQTDGVKSYIDWAVSQNYAVIDVNIPKHLTDLEDDLEHTESDLAEQRSKEALLLATYLWENYVEISDAPHIFILGVGAAYASIIELLKENERVFPRIDKVFFFVSEQSLHSCRTATDDELMHWYYRNSMVFTAPSHNIWEVMKKPKKRFGNLIQSKHDDIQAMLAGHKDEIFEAMSEATQGWEEPVEEVVVGKTNGADSEDDLMSNTLGKGKDPLQSPIRLPPTGNFALSPSRNNGTRSAGSPNRGR